MLFVTGSFCCLCAQQDFHDVAHHGHKAQAGDLAEAGVADLGGTPHEHPWPCVPVLGRGLCFTSCS